MRTVPKTAVEVTEESLDSSGDEALELLNLTRNHEVTSERFDWLYKNNPHGPAVMWSVRDSETGKMVGFTVCLPRKMLVNGEERLAWNGADFSIHPKYRSLGPAVKLRRAAKEQIDLGRADFLYAHPNEKMALIHSRVGHYSVGTMVRYAKPVRTGKYLSSAGIPKWLATAGSKVLDPIYCTTQGLRLKKPKHGYRTVENMEFDRRFDDLFQNHSHRHPVIGVRDSAYLNWRYRHNPLYETHAVLAEVDGNLTGYLLFKIDEDSISIKDLFPVHNPEIVQGLLRSLADWGYRERLSSLSFTLLETNPSIALLKEFGFGQRAETSQMFEYTPVGNDDSSILKNSDNWFISVGDRDV